MTAAGPAEVAAGPLGRAVSGTVIPGAISVAASVLAASGTIGDRGSQFALVLAQTAAVGWLGRLAWSRSREWATAGVVLAAAWIPTFLVASWIYAIDPSALDVGPPTQALALVELSLLALIAGYALWPRPRAPTAPDRVEILPAAPEPRWLVVWAVAGALGLAVVLETAGGPIYYVQHLNREGSLTQGHTYFVVVALALLFVAEVGAVLRWARGLPLGRLHRAGVVVALALVGLLGARLLIALALAQLALYYGLTRRRPRIRILAPLVALAAVTLILVGGALKRYTAYRVLHPQVGLGRYLQTVAPSEVPRAFANNYADGVRVIALSLATVPRAADYEYGKELLRLVLQPLPRSLRPVIETSPGLRVALYPGGGNAYAQPLPAMSYLQFGIAGTAVAFLLLGALLAEIDRRLTALRAVRPSTMLLVTAVIVDLPAVVRGPFANFVAFALAALLVMYVVARTSERLIGVPAGPEAPARRTAGSGGRPPTSVAGR